MKGGVFRFLSVIVLMLIGFFILMSLAAGGTIGQGIVSFFGVIIGIALAVLNFGG